MSKGLIKKLKGDIFFKFFCILLITFLLEMIINKQWLNYSFIMHIILESCCVFASLSIFFSLWYSITILNSKSILGIGFLAVSVFQALHIFFSLKNYMAPVTELSARMAFASRLTVSIILLLFVKSLVIKKVDKNLILAATLIITLLFTLVITINPNYPLLIYNNKPAAFNYLAEITVIAIFSYSFVKYNDTSIFRDDIKSFEDMRLAILLCIPAEIWFLIFPHYYMSTGHFLKIVSYLLFFRVIYIHTITYPYKKLQSRQLILDEKQQNQDDAVNFYNQVQTILNSLEQCVLMVNKNKIITMCNIATENLLNRNNDEIVGKNLDEMCKALKIDLNNDLNFSLNTTKDKNINRKVQLPLYVNNVKREVLIHLNPILDPSGQAYGFILVGTDITDLENSFEKTLRQEKLAILGQLGAGIVHEVRNYLSTVKGRSQIIELLSANDAIKRHAKNISKDVNDINNIMNEFLFLAKPQNTDLKKASITEIFQSIESMISSSSLVHGVNININLSNDNRYILCDESQIKQVILNLCKNAVEVVIGKDEAKIIIDSGYNESTDEIFIRVTDNGPGIPQENLEKIGTPFFTTKKNGTGLGLSTCFRIIKNHKGRISVESEFGKGASFTVFLPCINDNLNEKIEA